jgi:hypothetical protein
MNARLKEKYLISRLKLLNIDSLVMSSFGYFFISLGIMVSLFPPFLKFGNLNFYFCSGRLEVHVPLFDGPESFVFKFYWKVISLHVD